MDNKEQKLTELEHKLDVQKEKFNLLTTVILFVLALQLAGAIYTGISIKEAANEFIDLKTMQVDQVLKQLNNEVDPKLKIEKMTTDLIAKVGMRTSQTGIRKALVFSVGIQNIGSVAASDLTIKILLPEDVETEYQSTEDASFKYEMLASPSRDGMYVPPQATFRQLVVIPTTKRGVRALEHNRTLKLKVLLYSKFGLEDTQEIDIKVNNTLMRSLK